MSNQKEESMISRTSVFTISLIAFIAGLIIGLVVLGWWVWPVQWQGGGLEVLKIESQTDYLRAAIDSYTLNPDAQLARTRFDSLGANKGLILREIYLDSGKQYPPEIEAFATTVGGQEFLQEKAVEPATTPAASAPVSNWIADRPLWMTLCLSGLLVFFLALAILLIIIRSNRKKKQAHASEEIAINPQAAPEVEEAVIFSESNIPEDEPRQIQDADIPDWLKAPTEAIAPIPDQAVEEALEVELSEQDIDDIASNFPFGNFTNSKTEITQSSPAPELDFQNSSESLLETDDGSFRDQTAIGQETPEQTYMKFSGDILSITGLDDANAEKLENAGINAPLLLLKKCATPAGREEIAQKTGIDGTKLLEWVNFVDILRVKSLTLEDANILKDAGVDMIVELATRDAKSLHQKIKNTGAQFNIFYEVPSLQQVANWIEQAKELPRVVTY